MYTPIPHPTPTHQCAGAPPPPRPREECLVDTRANSNFVRSRSESRGVSGPLRDSPACPEPARKHDSRLRAPRLHVKGVGVGGVGVGGVGEVWPRALEEGRRRWRCQLTYGQLLRYGGQLLLGGDQALVLVLQARRLLVQALALRLGLDQLVLVRVRDRVRVRLRPPPGKGYLSICRITLLQPLYMSRLVGGSCWSDRAGLRREHASRHRHVEPPGARVQAGGWRCD